MLKVTISPERTQKMLNLLKKAKFNSSDIELLDEVFIDDKLVLIFDLKDSDDLMSELTVLKISKSDVDDLVNEMWSDDSKNGFEWLHEISSSCSSAERKQARIQLLYIKRHVFNQVMSERSVA